MQFSQFEQNLQKLAFPHLLRIVLDLRFPGNIRQNSGDSPSFPPDFVRSFISRPQITRSLASLFYGCPNIHAASIIPVPSLPNIPPSIHPRIPPPCPSQDVSIHHYDVTFSPAVSNKGIMRLLVRQVAEQHAAEFVSPSGRPLMPVFDGRKNLYTADALPFESRDFHVQLQDKEKRAGAGGGPGGAQRGEAARPRIFKVAVKLAEVYHVATLVQFLTGRQAEIPQVILQVGGGERKGARDEHARGRKRGMSM